LMLDDEVHAILTALAIVVAVAASYLALAQPGGYLVLAVLSPEGALGPYPEVVYEGQRLEFKVAILNGYDKPVLVKVEAASSCGGLAEWRPEWERIALVPAKGNVTLDYVGRAGGACERETLYFRLYEFNGDQWVYTGREAYISYKVKTLGGLP